MDNTTTFVQQMATQILQHLEGEEGWEETDMTQIEQRVRMLLQELGRETTKQAVERQEERYPAFESPCPCGGQARYVRRRTITLHTLFGTLKVRRCYYLCDNCHKGHAPLDRRLGLRPNALSAELERLAGLTGAHLPFQKGCDLFELLTHVRVSDQSMAGATRRLGTKVQEEEERLMQEAQEPEWLLRRRREEKHNAPRRLYGTLDATKVHIREGEEGSRWRDLKIGAWFETDSTPPATPDREWQIKAKNISYYGDICPVEHFSPLVWATGVRRHANLAEELIMIGDGAEWIWNLVTAHFPDAVQILDWFHAVEHLTPVAQAAFKSEETQKEWLKTMRDCLWEGQTETVIRSCRNLNERTPHEEIRKAAAYFETNQKRMRYDWFRSQGYQIGSGTIESAAKQIGMMRMKVPGAIWNEEHAILVSKARGAVLSYNWQSLPLAG